MANSRKKHFILKALLTCSLCFLVIILILFFLLTKPANAYARNDFSKIDPKTQKLANTYIKTWESPELRERCLAELHRQNPEWDFMFRTYSVLSFANLALHDSNKQKDYLALTDISIDDTLELEQNRGFKYFLMQYGQTGRWIDRPAQSQFVDGEIALMLAVRCIIEDKPVYSTMLTNRVDSMIQRMTKSPVLCAESYPNECWIFCNTISLAAIKLSDIIHQTDHSAFITEWLKTVKNNLVDPQTGLLRSAFTYDGTPVDSAKGPEGSSIWMVCHLLQIVDETFAQEQYTTARKELMGSIFGLGYSREWPKSAQGKADIDSGPVVPILKASPSASRLGLIAAAAFKDKEMFNKLTISLNTLASPVEQDNSLYYQLSNPLGDVVILYGLTVGPIWEKVNHSKTP